MSVNRQLENIYHFYYNPETMSDSTPMMQQYQRIKSRYRDAILFFRLGDFYEMFEDDAYEAAGILQLTLTKRGTAPMCGIPYHAYPSYARRLLQAGKKIAICEQTSQPTPGKGIVDRDVVEILTPGTVVDSEFLDATQPNYLVACAMIGKRFAIAWLDVSTGDFGATSGSEDTARAMLRRELVRFSPREVLIEEGLYQEHAWVRELLSAHRDILVGRTPGWEFDVKAGYQRLLTVLQVVNLKSFSLSETDPENGVCGALLGYVSHTAKPVLPQVQSIVIARSRDVVGLDESSLRNLEVVQNLRDNSRNFSLLGTLDETKSAMGSRLLRNWLLAPLLSIEEIRYRHESVSLLVSRQQSLGTIRQLISRMCDIPRMVSRLGLDRAGPRDMNALRDTLDRAVTIADIIESDLSGAGFWTMTDEEMFRFRDLSVLISRAIMTEPAMNVSEGGVIAPGYDTQLDELRAIHENSSGVLDAYLEEERASSGINSLKVRHNKIIGYYLEVSKGSLSLVPDHFQRRQSLVTGERYTTPRLTALEKEIESAEVRIVERETELFNEIRGILKVELSVFMHLASVISALDVFASFAYSALLRGYNRPEMAKGGELVLVGARHPVVEANSEAGSFVSNSLNLDPSAAFFGLITGPNMAGKSTFLRQTALICLMAQAGSFVPAEMARLPVVDQIFCRVGAQDNLSRGESTFLVEMNETAHIIRSATKDSLIIMDEVGRGTSTNDGLSIAWAVSEYILSRIQCKTLFATHYHELTLLSHTGLKNYSMAVREADGEVIFLKRIQEGASNNSYGIHVAQLAGLPREIVARAHTILGEIQASEEKAFSAPATPVDVPDQSGLFDSSELIASEIRGINPDRLTPMDALTMIHRWKKELSS